MPHERRQGPRFRAGEILSASQLNKVVELVESRLKRDQGPRVRNPLNVWVRLDEDLDAGTEISAKNTATATVWRKDISGNYVATTQQETVANYTATSHSENDFLEIHWLDGEWQPMPPGGSGGGIFGEGVITDADCANFTVTIDADAQTTWISSCESLPDSYGGEITIYDPCPDDQGHMFPWQESELEGKVVQFWRVFNAYTCEAEYHITHICVRKGCTDTN